MNDLVKTTSNDIVFSSEKALELVKFSEFMSQGSFMIPSHLQGKPADCMAVALQAASWNMSPFAVAQKTHIVNGTLGYEAQLVNAVISSSRAITGRFHYKTIGDWSKWKYRNVGTNGKTKHGGVNESGLGVQVGAVLSGDSEITWDDILYIEPIQIRNSPLWQTRPLQQLKYLAVKYWARIYCPEVILGVYTPDELRDEPEPIPAQEREINPAPQASDNLDIDDVFNDEHPPIEHPQAPESEPDIDDVFGDSPFSKSDELSGYVHDCHDIDSIREVEGYILEAKENGELSDSELAALKNECQAKRNSFK